MGRSCFCFLHRKVRKEVSNVEAYTGFASVYDLFMDNIPYEDLV